MHFKKIPPPAPLKNPQSFFLCGPCPIAQEALIAITRSENTRALLVEFILSQDCGHMLYKKAQSKHNFKELAVR